MSELRFRSCPPPEQLSRAVAVDDAAVQAHLPGCSECREQWQAMVALRRLTGEITVERPDPARIEAVRTRLLANRREPRRRSRPLVLMLGAGLAAALLLVFLWPRERLGTVHALGERPAVFSHGVVRHDEVVHLHEGSIQIEVAHLRKGERFRVQVGRSEVEVRGTAFQVSARGDDLQRVKVLRGLVELRRPGAAPLLLRALQEWPAPDVPALVREPSPQAPALPPKAGDGAERAESPPAPREGARLLAPRGAHQRVVAATRPAPADSSEVQLSGAAAPTGEPPRGSPAAVVAQRAEAPAPATTAPVGEAAAPAALPAEPTDPADVAFAAALKAVRGNDFAEAARLFARSLSLAGQRPIAEDAAYWVGIAQARSGQPGAAMRSLRLFLERYPRAPRREEVATILGWLLLDSGALDEAEARFRSAASAPFHQVRESAAAGLRAVAARRGAP